MIIQLELVFRSFITVRFGNPKPKPVTQPAPRRHRDKVYTKLTDCCRKWGVLASQRPNPLMRILRRESRYTDSLCPA